MELKQKLEDEVPVAVIGGGIVGPVMAYILGERGVRVHLYEARHKGINGSRGRAINLSLSRRGIDALVRMGVSDEVLKETAPYYGRCIHLPNSGGKTKLQFYIGNEKKEAIHSINRRRLSELVLKRLEENPNVKVFYGHQLINIEHKNKILHFNVKREGEEESNNKKSTKAKFIIGCDGFVLLCVKVYLDQFRIISKTYWTRSIMSCTFLKHKMESLPYSTQICFIYGS